jgi:hypothetical protein
MDAQDVADAWPSLPFSVKQTIEIIIDANQRRTSTTPSASFYIFATTIIDDTGREP